MNNTITLFNLFNFMPLNNEEKDLFNFDKLIINRFNYELDKGIFYLGGQVKMKHNDIINLVSIQQVREINEKRNQEYGGPYNSFESANMYTRHKDIELIEKMIKVYNVIMKTREK